MAIIRNVLASEATGHENLSGAIIILYSSTVFYYFSWIIMFNGMEIE